MTKILITGASGMVGKHLVDMCLDKGYYVRATDIRYDDRYDIYVKNFEFYQADLRDFDDCINPLHKTGHIYGEADSWEKRAKLIDKLDSELENAQRKTD